MGRGGRGALAGALNRREGGQCGGKQAPVPLRSAAHNLLPSRLPALHAGNTAPPTRQYVGAGVVDDQIRGELVKRLLQRPADRLEVLAITRPSLQLPRHVDGLPASE